MHALMHMNFYLLIPLERLNSTMN